MTKDEEHKARKAAEAAAQAELKKIKQRMRKPNVAEAQFLGAMFALDNLGLGEGITMSGDTIELRFFYKRESFNLKEGLDAPTRFLERLYNQFMAEAEAENPDLSGDLDAELNYWRKEFTKRKCPSLEKISTTNSDVAPLILWLAKNGGQG